MNRWIIFAILFVVTWFWLGTMFGITGGLLHTVIFVLALASLLTAIGFKAIPFALKKQWLWLIAIVGFGYLAMSYGWLGGMFPSAGVTPPATTVTTPQGCRASVTTELLGKASTLDVNAWDMESNTPYSSAVDLTTNCHIYKNGNKATDYIGPSADTSAEELSGYTVGDTIYYYCGGTGYYADPIEGLCVETQRQPLSIEAHAIMPEANSAITAYDDTGSTALSATASANYGDYNLTLGAGSEESIYIKLKNNVANKAYQFCAWGIVKFYNITDVKPQNVEATYTEVPTPVHMESVAVEVNTTTASLTRDYAMYKAGSPIMLHEWDSIKEQFVVTAHSTNDPQDRQSLTTSNNMNGFAIIAKDCTYARGDDGLIHFDFYGHDTSEADVGLDETETSPRGKQTGVQICAL